MAQLEERAELTLSTHCFRFEYQILNFLPGWCELSEAKLGGGGGEQLRPGSYRGLMTRHKS